MKHIFTLILVLFLFSSSLFADGDYLNLYEGNNEALKQFNSGKNTFIDSFLKDKFQINGMDYYVKIRNYSWGKIDTTYYRKGESNYYHYNNKIGEESVVLPIDPNVGDVWIESDSSWRYKVVAVNENFNTPYKTYNNCIQVKCEQLTNRDEHKSKLYNLYYSIEFGFVGSVNSKGDVSSYLVNIKSISQEKLFPKEDRGLFYYVNGEGKRVSKKTFGYAEPFSEGFAVVEKGLEFGYVGEDGKIIIKPKYEDAGAFHDGLAYVSLKGKYGYINNQDSIVIEPVYDYAENFTNGFAIVRKLNPDTSVYGRVRYVKSVINPKNEILGGRWFSNVEDFRNGKFRTSLKKEKYELDIKGVIIERALIPKDSLYNGLKQVHVIDKSPKFPTGKNGLIDFIVKNVKYPTSAVNEGIQGRVFVGFTISKKGKVEDVVVLRPVHPLLNKEALRIVKLMPYWTPGEHNGKKVRVAYRVPISFRLAR